MDALERTSLAARAHRALLDAIVSGELAPGARLRDREIAERLGISRTPVREALLRLADDGLVESEPNASTRVAPVDLAGAAEAFPVIAALHALAARLGVPALDAARLERMAAADRERTAALAAGEIERAIAADDRFHAVLLEASGNGELKRAIARLMPKIRRLDLMHFAVLSDAHAGADPETVAAVDRHGEILAACSRADAAHAAALIERSFLALGEQVAAILDHTEPA